MHQYDAGEPFDTCVIVNKTKNDPISVPQLAPENIHYRHNVGMNIGAWDHGWRIFPGYKNYLFLQDECYVIRPNWLSGYRAVLESRRVGLVGESVNQLWDVPWSELRTLLADSVLLDHRIEGKCVNRVDFYLDFLKTKGIKPGNRGTHLRSVVWFLSADVLRQIDGFLIGRNYGECIAAEIATSKKVEALGLDFVQVNPHEEFFYIRHLEYNQDSPGSPYAHDVKYVDYASVRRLIEAKEDQVWPLLKHKLKKILTTKRL
jgi:hypothetical protein